MKAESIKGAMVWSGYSRSVLATIVSKSSFVEVEAYGTIRGKPFKAELAMAQHGINLTWYFNRGNNLLPAEVKSIRRLLRKMFYDILKQKPDWDQNLVQYICDSRDNLRSMKAA